MQLTDRERSDRFCLGQPAGVRQGVDQSRIFAAPLPISAAFDLVDSWLGQPPSTVPAPTARHAALLRGLLEQTGAAGNLTTDAHLAALAMEHSADVVTFDRDFGRFGVRMHIPE